MDEAPPGEGPRRPVPEAAEDEGDDEVRVGRHPAAAVPRQGEEDVVAEPGRERDVPAPPELREVGGPVGRVEVLLEAEAEEERRADGDVAVAGEVRPDLGRVAVDRDPRLRRGVEARDLEDAVDEVDGEDVGDQALLHEAEPDPEERPAPVLVREGRERPGRLREEGPRPRDRPREERREEGDEREVVEEAPRGLLVAPVDVDDAAERLERVEGNPRGEDERERRPRDVVGPAEEGRGRPREEARVLEGREEAEVDDDARGDERASERRSLGPAQGARDVVVDGRRREERQEGERVPRRVEDEAQRYEDERPRRPVPGEPHGEDRDREEEEIDRLREAHGARPSRASYARRRRPTTRSASLS